MKINHLLLALIAVIVLPASTMFGGIVTSLSNVPLSDPPSTNPISIGLPSNPFPGEVATDYLGNQYVWVPGSGWVPSGNIFQLPPVKPTSPPTNIAIPVQTPNPFPVPPTSLPADLNFN